MYALHQYIQDINTTNTSMHVLHLYMQYINTLRLRLLNLISADEVQFPAKAAVSHSFLKHGLITVTNLFWSACKIPDASVGFPWVGVCYWITIVKQYMHSYTHTCNTLIHGINQFIQYIKNMQYVGFTFRLILSTF